MEKGIQKIISPHNPIGPLNSVSIIGDPGCDGLGASTMSVFAKALTAAPSDLNIIAGDIVHRGIHRLYASVSRFVRKISPVPVYMTCGNHDTEHYEEFFGLRNYLLFDDKTLLIFLDNSKRKFEGPTLEFLKDGLEKFQQDHVVILFHIPAPNSVSTNTLSHEEWAKFMHVAAPHKTRIRYLISGHVHSYYEDMVDGMKLLVTGGGGARIEPVNDRKETPRGSHHILRLFYTTGKNLCYEILPLHQSRYETELNDPKLKDFLENAFVNEAIAHMKYRLYAMEANQRNLPGLAGLFSAFADSEYHHARNHFQILNEKGFPLAQLEKSAESENHEVTHLYREYLNYAETMNFGLAEYTFRDSLEAEKVHGKMIEEALSSLRQGEDIPEAQYYTCTSCGFTFRGDSHPRHCPVCGAPENRIRLVEKTLGY